MWRHHSVCLWSSFQLHLFYIYQIIVISTFIVHLVLLIFILHLFRPPVPALNARTGLFHYSSILPSLHIVFFVRHWFFRFYLGGFGEIWMVRAVAPLKCRLFVTLLHAQSERVCVKSSLRFVCLAENMLWDVERSSERRYCFEIFRWPQSSLSNSL